jgi:hypothetical protein
MANMMKVGTHRTTVAKYEEETLVTYHETVVVGFTDSSVILDSGGHMTRTTRTRMNQASNEYNLGYQVHQKKGKWLVSFSDGEVKEFYDGMIFKIQ